MHKVALEGKSYRAEILVDLQNFENVIKDKDKGAKNIYQFRIFRGEN
jgi:hypothetical protein